VCLFPTGKSTRLTLPSSDVQLYVDRGGAAIELVVDTSALLAVLLNQPERPAVVAATEGSQILAAPSLPWEVGNALIALRRRRRVESEDIQRAWKAFGRVPIRLIEIDISEALRLAEMHHMYAYDAYVLQAARTARTPLVSLDLKLIRAARASGIAIQEVAK